MAMPLTHRSYPKRWTAYDVRALMEASPTHWPRYEAIDGELIVTPARRLAHQEVLELLRDVLKPYVAQYALGRVLGSPADLELEKDSIIQPDLFVVPASLSHAREWADVTTCPSTGSSTCLAGWSSAGGLAIATLRCSPRRWSGIPPDLTSR